MARIDFANRTAELKIVYCGPSGCGKRTNLRHVHRFAPRTSISDLIVERDESGHERLHFHLVLPNHFSVAGLRISWEFLTNSSQSDEAIKSSLRGCDGVVFIADSNPSLFEENANAFEQVKRCLIAINPDSCTRVPLVLQFNKRDLAQAVAVTELNGCSITRAGKSLRP